MIVCVALAVVKAAIAALLLVLLIMSVWGACRYPKEMFGFASYVAALCLINAYPAHVLVFLAAVILLSQIANDRPKPS